MNKIILANVDGSPLDVWTGIKDGPVLVTEGLRTLDCHWQSGVNDAAETTTIVSTKPNQSLLLTDIIVTSSKKVASSTITLRFFDGTNTETLMVIEGAEAPVEFAHTFQGGVRGWKDADFQVVTNQAAMYSVTFVGYVHLSPDLTQSYTVWNKKR